MVTHQPKDGHPPEGSMLQTRNLALSDKSRELVMNDKSKVIIQELQVKSDISTVTSYELQVNS